ncbi:MAG: hypothetical protein AAF721_34505 [Myxococcota bacterium]
MALTLAAAAIPIACVEAEPVVEAMDRDGGLPGDCVLPGDVLVSGRVDVGDLNRVTQNWTGALPPGTGERTFEQGDADADGDVDTNDRNIVTQHFGWRCVEATALEGTEDGLVAGHYVLHQVDGETLGIDIVGPVGESVATYTVATNGAEQFHVVTLENGDVLSISGSVDDLDAVAVQFSSNGELHDVLDLAGEIPDGLLDAVEVWSRAASDPGVVQALAENGEQPGPTRFAQCALPFFFFHVLSVIAAALTAAVVYLAIVSGPGLAISRQLERLMLLLAAIWAIIAFFRADAVCCMRWSTGTHFAQLCGCDAVPLGGVQLGLDTVVDHTLFGYPFVQQQYNAEGDTVIAQCRNDPGLCTFTCVPGETADDWIEEGPCEGIAFQCSESSLSEDGECVPHADFSGPFDSFPVQSVCVEPG